MYRLGVFDLDHSFTHHFCALKNTAACKPNWQIEKKISVKQTKLKQ